MKRLLIVRHAQAEDAIDGDDHGRPLTPKGHADALMLGTAIKSAAFWPELVLISTAKRVAETLADMQIGMESDDFVVQTAENIYQGRLYDITKLIQSTQDEVSHLMVIGHNPILTELVNYLSGETIEHLQTCGAWMLTFEMEQWAELEGVKPSISQLSC